MFTVCVDPLKPRLDLWQRSGRTSSNATYAQPDFFSSGAGILNLAQELDRRSLPEGAIRARPRNIVQNPWAHSSSSGIERIQIRGHIMTTQALISEETEWLSEHEIVSREEWLVARKDLLSQRKAAYAVTGQASC